MSEKRNDYVFHVEQKIAQLTSDLVNCKKDYSILAKEHAMGQVLIMGYRERLEPSKCHVCHLLTDMDCSDCRIEFGTTIFVCRSSKCRDIHEMKCPYKVRSTLAIAGRFLTEADRIMNDAIPQVDYYSIVKEEMENWRKDLNEQMESLKNKED